MSVLSSSFDFAYSQKKKKKKKMDEMEGVYTTGLSVLLTFISECVVAVTAQYAILVADTDMIGKYLFNKMAILVLFDF